MMQNETSHMNSQPSLIVTVHLTCIILFRNSPLKMEQPQVYVQDQARYKAMVPKEMLHDFLIMFNSNYMRIMQDLRSIPLSD